MRTETNTPDRETYIAICQDENGQPFSVEASVYFDNEVERDEFISSFPKSVGIRANINVGMRRQPIPIAQMRVNFRSNDVNKGINEAGIKRACRFLAAVAESGREIYYAPIENGMTIEEFIAKEGQ